MAVNTSDKKATVALDMARYSTIKFEVVKDGTGRPEQPW